MELDMLVLCYAIYYLFILPQRYYFEPDSRSVMSFPSGKVENDYRILKPLDGGNFKKLRDRSYCDKDIMLVKLKEPIGLINS
jgi:hypothetical protein